MFHRTWVEECLWVSLKGDLGQQPTQQRILAALPSATSPMTVAASMSRMEALGKTTLFSFCGRGLAGQHGVILDWLHAYVHLVARREPAELGEVVDRQDHLEGGTRQGQSQVDRWPAEEEVVGGQAEGQEG